MTRAKNKPAPLLEHSLGHLLSYTGSSMLPITYAFPPWFWETEAWILTLPLGERWILYETKEISSTQITIVSPHSSLLPLPSCCRTGALEGLAIWLLPSNGSQSIPATLGSHYLTHHSHLQLSPWQSWSPGKGNDNFHIQKTSFFHLSLHPYHPFFRVTRRKSVSWCSISLVWITTRTVFKWWFLPLQL